MLPIFLHDPLRCALPLLLAGLALQATPPSGTPGSAPPGNPPTEAPAGGRKSDNQPSLAPPPRGGKAPAGKSAPAAPAKPATPATPAPAAPAIPQATAPAPVATKDGLEATPLVLESLGLRMRPPTGSVMRADGAGLAANWTVTERADPPRFILRISRLIASVPASSPKDQMEEYIKAVTGRITDPSLFTVRQRREFTVAGQPAGFLATTLREEDQGEELAAVQGYLLIQTEPNEFIVISSLVSEADYATVAPLLERAYQTIELITSDEVMKARAARFTAGQHLLEGLDEEGLRRALDGRTVNGRAPAPRWYRITRHLADGTLQEVGYMTVSVVEAAQGEANPDRPRAQWTKEEQEPGMLVRVQVRTLLDQEGTAVQDTDLRAWMRWDRAREFWTSRSTARKGRTARTISQLGVRAAPTPAQPRPVLEVSNIDPTEPSTEPKRWPVPAVGYLSQAEALVLPRLIPSSPADGDYAFYWFDPRSVRLTQRTDRRGPATGGFTLATQPTPEAPATEQLLDPRGALLRRETDDGTVTEAIAPEALLEIWRKKGLPTG
ncbi:MAG: hypothetical protein U0625_05860 [Phycisphaerales bacterium]